MEEKDLIVISLYPPEGSLHGSRFGGVASFAKNSLLALQESNPNLKILVLANHEGNVKKWFEKNIEVRRIWKQGSPKAYFSLLKEIFNTQSSKVLVQFEWSMFGRMDLLLLLPFFLTALRLSGREIFFVSHGVSLSFKSIAGQTGIKSPVLMKIGDLILWCFYLTLGLTVNKIIVLEEYLANLLKESLPIENVVAISHGVERREKGKPNLNRKTFNILYFGFLSWYKGPDLLIKAFGKLPGTINGQKLRLILAGQGNPAHKKSRAQKVYLEKLEDGVRNIKNRVTCVGFVPEEEISDYFSKADLVVFPYRAFIASSGALSLALAHEKAVALSQNLTNYRQSVDFQEAMDLSGLGEKDLFFDLNEKSLFRAVQGAMDCSKKEKFLLFARLLAQKRDFHLLANKYSEVLGLNPAPSYNQSLEFVPA